MTLEAQCVSRVSEDAFGSLNSCLVEGDPQSEKRARRIKQRAVAISIVFQTLALAALVLFPLLSKGERISLKDMTPIPPYAHIGDHRTSTASQQHRTGAPRLCSICAPRNVPPTIVNHVSFNAEPQGDALGDPILGLDATLGFTGGRPPIDTRPADTHTGGTHPVTQRRSVSEPLQMAQLIHRVEPIYPALARQIRHEGRVELRALISTTGTIESLEVISGDSLFIQSALAAVREWRYRPTILDGRPVEVDTHITVIYTLSH